MWFSHLLMVLYKVWESKKNPSLNVALGKIREHGSAHGVNIAVFVIWKISRRLSRKKNNQWL